MTRKMKPVPCWSKFDSRRRATGTTPVGVVPLTPVNGRFGAFWPGSEHTHSFISQAAARVCVLHRDVQRRAECTSPTEIVEHVLPRDGATGEEGGFVSDTQYANSCSVFPIQSCGSARASRLQEIPRQTPHPEIRASATRVLRAAQIRATLLGTPGRQESVARGADPRNAPVARGRRIGDRDATGPYIRRDR